MNKHALAIVKPGGFFVTCSCSGLVSRDEFFAIVRGAARSADRRVQVLQMTGRRGGSSGDDGLSRVGLPEMPLVPGSLNLGIAFCSGCPQDRNHQVTKSPRVQEKK